MTSEFPDPKPVRTISLRPDGTPIGAPAPLIKPASDAKACSRRRRSQPSKPAEAPSRSPRRRRQATRRASRSRRRPRSNCRPSFHRPSRLRAWRSAKPIRPPLTATAQTPGEPAQNGAPAKPEKAAKKPKAGQVADATETTGAIAPPVDATAATTSGGWSVQLAAPKSEAEAQSTMTKLNSKYGAELNGSAIGVHKAEVNGETIYRLRVSGLTKADAAAMCARLKGEGGQCFIAK